MGCKLSRAVYLPPPLHHTLVLRVIFFSCSFHLFQISEYEVDSFITIIQVKLSCCLCCLISLTFDAGVWGGSCPGQFILPHTWVLCLIFFYAHFTCFKLSVHEVEPFIIIIQVKLSCFLCCWSHTHSCRGGGGGGKLSRAVYLAPTWVMRVIFSHAHLTCFKYLNMKLIHL